MLSTKVISFKACQQIGRPQRRATEYSGVGKSDLQEYFKTNMCILAQEWRSDEEVIVVYNYLTKSKHDNNCNVREHRY